MIKKLIEKYNNKELGKYLMWKLGINSLIRFLKNPIRVSKYKYYYSKYKKTDLKNYKKYLNLKFNYLKNKESDINEHLKTLYLHALECETIFETGVRGVVSSWAFLKGLSESEFNTKYFFLNDINKCDIEEIKSVANGLNITLDWVWKNNLDIEFDRKFDLIFIDTWHVYGQLKRELAKFSKLTKKYIILHDTTLDGVTGESIRFNQNIEEQAAETGFTKEEIEKGLWPAVEEFLAEEKSWYLIKRYENNNGLTILKRIN